MQTIHIPEKISIKGHPEINEKAIQEIIANDPSIIGLGDLILKDKERRQPRAGRLDLLLQEPDFGRRYEVEIQLGKTDESHIIRTLEYWDIERKRYPQYDHCAVIIAEDITSRFMNVISLFNGYLPIIAIQMNAYKLDGKLGLVFTKVLDELELGLPDEEEEIVEVTDRKNWQNKLSPKIMEMVDFIIGLVKKCDERFNPNYNKRYIGFQTNGKPETFVLIYPQKKGVKFAFKYPKSEEIEKLIENSELELITYNHRRKRYFVRIQTADLENEGATMETIVSKAFENYSS